MCATLELGRRVSGPTFKRFAEGNLGSITGLFSQHCQPDVALSQPSGGLVHPPSGEAVERTASNDLLKPQGEARPRHTNETGKEALPGAGSHGDRQTRTHRRSVASSPLHASDMGHNFPTFPGLVARFPECNETLAQIAGWLKATMTAATKPAL